MISMENFSIKKKLIAIQLLTAFIVLIFYGIFLVFNDLRVFRKSVVDQLTSMAEIIGANSISALNFLDNEAAGNILASLALEEDIVNAWIHDADGNLFAKYSRVGYSNFSFPEIEEESCLFSWNYVTLSKRITQDDNIIGRVSLRLNTEKFRYIVHQIIIVAFFALILGMAIAFVLSMITQGTISNPIRNLAVTTKNVSETGNYAIRVEKEGHDEIGLLYDGFNDMLEQIQRREVDRDRAENALRESEEKFRTLTSNIPGAVYRCANDRAWTMDFISETIEEISGYPTSDFVQNSVRSYASILYPEDREMVGGIVEEAISKRAPFIIDYRIVRSDGSVRWVYEKGQPIFSDDGNVLWLDGVIFDITERKHDELELAKHKEHLEELVEERTRDLRASEKKYRLLADNVSDTIWTLDLKEHFTYLSPSIERLAGYTQEEAAHLTLAGILTPSSLQIARESIRRRFAEGDYERTEFLELEILRKDGSAFWSEITSTPVLDEEGNISGFLGITRDITERIKAQEALKESEERLRLALDATNTGLWDLDLRTGKVYRSPHLYSKLGYGSDEMARTREEFCRLVHPDDLEPMRRRFEEHLERGSEYKAEIRIKRKNGEWCWFIDSGEVIERDNDGRPLRMVGTDVDISDLKRAEEALRESEERFRSISASALDAIIMMDHEGNISYWNEAAEKIFGYSSQEALGGECHLFLAPQHSHETYREGFSRFKLTGQGAAVGKTLELAAVRRDGTEFPIELSVSAVKLQGKWNAIGILRDITERKQAEEAIRQANVELHQANEELKSTQIQLVQSQKMASLGKLVAGVAHEFNNPIGAVLSSNNTLKVGIRKFEAACDEAKNTVCQARPETQRVLAAMENSQRVIEEGAQRVAAIVKRMTAFARLDESEIKRVDIYESLEDTIFMFQHELKPGVTFRKDFDELPLITCYPARLNQLFLQLFRNANQAMEREGEIVVRTRRDEDAVHIAISDTGRGIPQQDLDKIFDPGFTTWGVGVGVGLGLSICYQIVQENHGRIEVESKVGRGTTFTIIISTHLEQILNKTLRNP